jgi:uncharacterized membrane protein
MENRKDTHAVVRRIAQNGLVAALYYAITMLLIAVPVLSQFGPIQCRVSEVLMVFAFFRPDLTLGLTIGCFLANTTGAFMGLVPAVDMVIGTAATFLSCICMAYLSCHMIFACIYPVLFNGVFVGLELYFFLELKEIPLIATMGYVALGELIAVALGYGLFMALIRNRGFMSVLKPTRHAEVRW